MIALKIRLIIPLQQLNTAEKLYDLKQIIFKENVGKKKTHSRGLAFTKTKRIILKSLMLLRMQTQTTIKLHQ